MDKTKRDIPHADDTLMPQRAFCAAICILGVSLVLVLVAIVYIVAQLALI